MVKFLHTSDWQLGITRYFLNEGAQERFSRARFASIRAIGRICRSEGCEFVVVAGDVFESNQVGRKTVTRALEALGEIPVPVYLLPGNHDPLNEASVYSGHAFASDKPGHVHVIGDSRPIAVAEGVELVGAPWTAKRFAANPLHGILADLEPAADRLRICLAHGGVDSLAGFDDSPDLIALDLMRKALDGSKAHFFALGDKHSYTRVDEAGRIWYSGTPEATAFREPDPGHVNLVTLDHDRAVCVKIQTGAWSFREIAGDSLADAGDVERLLEGLAAIPDKENCVVRLRLSGVIGLREVERLEERLGNLGDRFASLEVRQETLHTRIDETEAIAAGFTGFAAEAAARLEERVAGAGPDAVRARDALLLLLRLSRGRPPGNLETGA